MESAQIFVYCSGEKDLPVRSHGHPCATPFARPAEALCLLPDCTIPLRSTFCTGQSEPCSPSRIALKSRRTVSMTDAIKEPLSQMIEAFARILKQDVEQRLQPAGNGTLNL